MLNLAKIACQVTCLLLIAACIAPSSAQMLTRSDFMRESRQADQFMNEGHQDAAKHILLALVRTPWVTSHEYVQLSYAFLYAIPSKSDFDAAEHFARMAVKLDPECGPGYTALAAALIEQQELPECIRCATKGYTCKKPNDYALFIRARAYAAQHKYNEALADAELWGKLIGKTDKRQVPNIMEGEILERLGRTDDAIKKYRADMQFHPEDALKNIVRCLQIAKRYPEAIVEASSLIKRNPADSDAYNLRASVKSLSKDWNGAIQDYSRAIELSPTSTYYHNRARAYEALGKTDLAKKDIAEAAKSIF